jgi:hypothetical protein
MLIKKYENLLKKFQNIGNFSDIKSDLDQYSNSLLNREIIVKND